MATSPSAAPATRAAVSVAVLVSSAVMVSFFDGEHKVHNQVAHVLSVGSIDEETGQPVLSVAFPNPATPPRTFGSPRWYEGYKRETGVLHFSHPRVKAGQESIAWGHPFPGSEVDPLIPVPENSADRPYFERQVLPEVLEPSIEQAAAVQSGLAPNPTTQSPLVNTPGDAVGERVPSPAQDTAPDAPPPAPAASEAPMASGDNPAAAGAPESVPAQG